MADNGVGALGNFGTSVALQGDVLAVGATPRFSPGDEGQVILYERDSGAGGTWGKVLTIFEGDVGGSGAGTAAWTQHLVAPWHSTGTCC